jgi:hypothetical protein
MLTWYSCVYATAMNTTRENREQAGVCLTCGGPRTSEAKRCRTCTTKQVELNKKTKNTRQRRKEEGVCIDCGGTHDLKASRCSSCRARDSDYRRKRRAENKMLCINCGNRMCDLNDLMDPICRVCREDHPTFMEMLAVNSEFDNIFYRSGLTIPKFIATVEAIHSHTGVPRKMQSDTFARQPLDLLLDKSRKVPPADWASQSADKTDN